MTTRPPADATLDEHGDEAHPAFGMISACRVSATPGVTLFDSDVRHARFVEVRVSSATRKRRGMHDYVHEGKIDVVLRMSEAQWASFVSSMNTSGVPCTTTLRRTGPLEECDGVPYAPRLARTMRETHEAAEVAFAEIRDALAAYEALPDSPRARKHRALDDLRARIVNATPNVVYAGRRLAEHAEDVVQKARADVEAMVASHARRLGLATGPDSGALLELGATTAPVEFPEYPDDDDEPENGRWSGR